VKSSLRGIGLAFLTACALGLPGCGADNESEADKAQKNLGAVPETTVKGGEATPPPASYGQRQPPALNQEYTQGVTGKKAPSKR
jgi:hypothetical protein